MLSYRLECRKKIENKNPKVVRTNYERIMLLSTCAVCNSKKSKFLKKTRSYNLDHNICDFVMFYQIFLSQQMRRIVTIGNKYGIYEFPHELPNDLRFSILGN